MKSLTSPLKQFALFFLLIVGLAIYSPAAQAQSLNDRILALPDELPEPLPEISDLERMLGSISSLGGLRQIGEHHAYKKLAIVDYVAGTEFTDKITNHYNFWSSRVEGTSGIPDPNLESDVLRFFNFATGVSGGGCYTCAVTQNLGLSLSVASQTVYSFWVDVMMTLLAGIVAVNAIYLIGRQMWNVDGSTPGDLLRSLGARGLASMVVVVLLKGGSLFPGSNATLWSASGPAVLEASFEFASDARERLAGTLRNETVGSGSVIPPALPPEWRTLIETYVAQRRSFGQSQEDGYIIRRGFHDSFTMEVSEVERQWLALDRETRRTLITAYIALANTEYEPNDPMLGCGRTHLYQMSKYVESQGIANPAQDPRTAFIADMTTMNCMVERVQALGVSVGLATVFAQEKHYEDDDLHSAAVMKQAVGYISKGSLKNTLLKLVLGLTIVYIFGFAALRLIFMLAEVVLRVMIIASFSPVLAACAIFPSTRKYTFAAMRILVGALAMGVSITIINILNLAMVTRLPLIFNTISQSSNHYAGTLEPIDAANTLSGFKMFIMRIMDVDGIGQTPIPMDIYSPWIIPIAVIGLMSSSLSKKTQQMIHQFVGAKDESPLADRAVKTGAAMVGFAKSGAKTVGLAGISMVPFVGGIAAGGIGMAGKAGGSISTELSSASGGMRASAGRLSGG